MSVFNLHAKVLSDYCDFIRSFFTIDDDRIRAFVGAPVKSTESWRMLPGHPLAHRAGLLTRGEEVSPRRRDFRWGYDRGRSQPIALPSIPERSLSNPRSPATEWDERNARGTDRETRTAGRSLARPSPLTRMLPKSARRPTSSPNEIRTVVDPNVQTRDRRFLATPAGTRHVAAVYLGGCSVPERLV